MSNHLKICHIFTNSRTESALCKEQYHGDFVSENVNLFPLVYLKAIGLLFPKYEN